MELGKSQPGPDNPIFRFETPWGSHTQGSPVVQSRYFSQIDVTAIEMIASGTGVHARVYIDLEEGPLLPQEPKAANVIRSRMEIEGDEKAVFDLWHDLNAIVQLRRSRSADLMNDPLSAVFLFFGGLVVVLGLPVLTAQRLHLTGNQLTQVALGIALAAVAIFVVALVLRVPTVLWPRIAIQGWGRLERSRATFQWWSGGIVLGIVGWAVGLAILWVWGPH